MSTNSKTKSKYPYRVTSVAPLPEPGTVCVVSRNGYVIHLTAADLTYLNHGARIISGDAHKVQLSDLMGQDIRLLMSIRSMRLGLVD